MKQYLDLLQDILDNGNDRSDRTGVGTRSVFGRQVRFNMEDGFPAVTTKKLAWKAVVSELLFFLEGSTNEHRLAEIKNDNKPYDELSDKQKKTIWTDNYENQGKALGYTDGELGPVYGHQWRTIYDINFDKLVISKSIEYDDVETPLPTMEKINYESNNDLIGKIFKSKFGYECIVYDIEKSTNKDDLHIGYKVQFLTTHSKRTFRKYQLESGNFIDNYYPSVFGIGYSGEAITKINKKHTREYTVWHSMMGRCYNPLNKSYNNYGGKGVKVCKRWHNFENFLKDLPQIPYYHIWLNDRTYQIDKDILSGYIYSPKTCMFIPGKFNGILAVSKPIEYEGKIYLNIKQLCQTFNFSQTKVYNQLHGIKIYDELKNIKYATVDDGYHIGYKFNCIDQLSNVINLIKTQPDSRRLVVSAWNPKELDAMALMPCHYSFQFYVEGDKLSLMYNMRSNDCFLGKPFNDASYALLLHIVAKMTNKIPYELIASLGDAHIYNNHMEQVKEQLKRTPHKLPTLKLPDIDWSGTIDDVLKQVKTSDFVLENYECDEAIKAPMAV